MRLNRKLFIVLGGVGIAFLIFGFTVPFLPVALPEGVWSEEEFAVVDSQLKEAAEKINLEVTSEEEFPRVMFNLMADFERNRYRESLFRTSRVGFSSQRSIVYGTLLPEGVPFLEYDPVEKTARITPEKLESFLGWLAEDEKRESLAYRAEVEEGAAR